LSDTAHTIRCCIRARTPEGKHVFSITDGKNVHDDTVDMLQAWQREKSCKSACEGFGWTPENVPALSLELSRLARQWDSEHVNGNGKSDGPIPMSICADSVTTRPIKWLTPQFPLGKYSTIIGHPGLGKSLLDIDLAARVSIGAPGPGSDKATEPADVIMIQNEDDVEDTVVPRLIAAGADLSRVHFLTGIAAYDKTGVRPFTLEDVWAIEKLADGLGRLRLVTIDPVGSYCGRADAHRDAEVRGLLMPLADVARRREISIIGNAHFNKGSGRAIDRGMGSVAWVAAARAAWGVVKDTDDPGNRLFLPIKCNLSKDTVGLSFRIVDAGMAPCLAWNDTPETRTMDDVLTAQQNSKRSPKTTEAIEWLRCLLADGALSVGVITEQGKAAGHDFRTLKNAKSTLGVKSYAEGFGKECVWFWELAQK
jgi:putative DNA primase/helicase